MGVVVRRYIDILTIIIYFPYSTCISSFFGSSIPTSLFIFKMFFRLCLCNFCTIYIQWNPSIVATIRDQPFGLYRGVATSQGLFYIIDKTCTCMV